MGENNNYEEHVDEADLDLFYGFFDSVMKETSDSEEQSESPLAGKIAEWAPEPFEEFVVGMPSQESARYYNLNVGVPTNQMALHHEPLSEKGSGAGTMIGLTVFASIMLSAYNLSHEAPSSADSATIAHIEKIESGLNAVEQKVESVEILQQQVQSMQQHLQQLSSLVSQSPQAHTTPKAPEALTVERRNTAELATVSKPIRALLTSSVVKEESVLDPMITPAKPATAPWVLNLASSRSASKASHELSRIRALGIDAESVAIDVKGKTWTRIRVTGYTSKHDAQLAITELTEKTGLQHIWVGKR